MDYTQYSTNTKKKTRFRSSIPYNGPSGTGQGSSLVCLHCYCYCLVRLRKPDIPSQLHVGQKSGHTQRRQRTSCISEEIPTHRTDPFMSRVRTALSTNRRTEVGNAWCAGFLYRAWKMPLAALAGNELFWRERRVCRVITVFAQSQLTLKPVAAI